MITADEIFERDGHETVATVMDTDTVADLLRVLSTHGVTSAPVLTLADDDGFDNDDGDNDAAADNNNNGDENEARPPKTAQQNAKAVYSGAVDVLDVIGALLSEEVASSSTKDLMQAWAARAPHFFSQRVADIMGNSPTNPLAIVHGDATLDEVLGKFSLEVRRVTDVSPDGTVRRVLSAWGVVRFLARDDGEAMGHCAGKPLSSLPSGKPVELVGVSATDTALAAFDVLFGSTIPIYGAPVLDADGFLVDVVSASDTRGLTAENFADLELPVTEYMARRAEESGRERGRPVTCTMDATLLEVAQLIADREVHRVFIVEGNSEEWVRPIGVVSCTDIIEEVCRSRTNVDRFSGAVRKIMKMGRTTKVLKSMLL